MYGEHVALTLGCSSSIFTGDFFPCGIDDIQLKNQSIFGLRFFFIFLNNILNFISFNLSFNLANEQ